MRRRRKKAAPAPDRRRIGIDGQSHDGKGLARIDGKVAFVPGALAGETVEAVLYQRRGRYDEYRLLEVICAAPERVAPPCPLVGRCGGCDLQHLAADAQLRHKTRVVLELLERQARLVPETLAEPLRSAPFGYRRRARLAVSVPRRGGRPLLGFREAGGREVVSVSVCPVLKPPLDALPGALQALLGELHRPAGVGHLELSLAECTGGDGTGGVAAHPVIHVHAVAPPNEHDLALLGDFAAAHGAYLSVGTPDGPIRYLHQPLPEAPAYLLPEFDLRIAYQPGDFLQGNAAVNRLLVERVVGWLGACGDGPVLDAFAGLGNFSLALARRGLDVLGLEAAPQMVTRARDNARDNGLARCEFACRDLLAQEQPLGRSDFVAAVLDPPRAGAQALVRDLAAKRTGTILYVSCWPPTLARDAALLAEAGYRLDRLGLVDMFPQTSHIEAMALFTRTDRRARRRA